MLLQIDTIALAEELLTQAEEPVQETSINLWEMAQYGGWIMVILAILLAVACYIFIARLVVIKQATHEDKSFMDRIRDYIFAIISMTEKSTLRSIYASRPIPLPRT